MTDPTNAATERERELATALRGLLEDFKWLLEQHPEHTGWCADSKVDELEAMLSE